jgi:hypothetical protein
MGKDVVVDRAGLDHPKPADDRRYACIDTATGLSKTIVGIAGR